MTKYNTSSLQINPAINSSARPDIESQYVISRIKSIPCHIPPTKFSAANKANVPIAATTW